jgi:hypothetical protein
VKGMLAAFLKITRIVSPTYWFRKPAIVALPIYELTLLAIMSTKQTKPHRASQGINVKYSS